MGNSPWAYPTRSGKGHLQESKSFTSRVGARCGHAFTVHDLQLTLITIAEALGIPAYALRRLLNDRTSSDVTGSYITMDVERLRGPPEDIATRLFEPYGR